MKKFLLPFLFLIASLSYAGTKLLAPTNMPNSSSLPATCTTGDAYQNTSASSGGQWYLCESTNIWVVQGGGGSGSPGGSPGNVQYNNSGAFGGITSANFTSATNSLVVGATTTFQGSTTTFTGNVTITLSSGSALVTNTGSTVTISGKLAVNSITFLDGTVQVTSPTANAGQVYYSTGNIHAQNTLQTGATAYPEWLHTSSITVSPGGMNVTGFATFNNQITGNGGAVITGNIAGDSLNIGNSGFIGTNLEVNGTIAGVSAGAAPTLFGGYVGDVGTDFDSMLIFGVGGASGATAYADFNPGGSSFNNMSFGDNTNSIVWSFNDGFGGASIGASTGGLDFNGTDHISLISGVILMRSLTKVRPLSLDNVFQVTTAAYNLTDGNFFTGSNPVSRGGTSTTTFNAQGVLIGKGTNAIVATSSSSVYAVLVSSGIGDPFFATTLSTQVIGTIQPANLVSTVAYTTDSSTDSFSFSISTAGWNNMVFPGAALDFVNGSTITYVQCETMPAVSTVTFSLQYRGFGQLNSSGTNYFNVTFSSANSTGVVLSSFSAVSRQGLVPANGSLEIVTGGNAASGSPTLLRVDVFYRRRRG